MELAVLARVVLSHSLLGKSHQFVASVFSSLKVGAIIPSQQERECHTSSRNGL